MLAPTHFFFKYDMQNDMNNSIYEKSFEATKCSILSTDEYEEKLMIFFIYLENATAYRQLN